MNLFNLEGKTALVTGCKKGIGMAMAIALAEAISALYCMDLNCENDFYRGIVDRENIRDYLENKLFSFNVPYIRKHFLLHIFKKILSYVVDYKRPMFMDYVLINFSCPCTVTLHNT